MGMIPVDSRLMKILTKANTKEFNQLDEFAEFAGVSSRTIRNYIKELNDILVPKGIGEIVQVKETGYKIVVYDQQKYNELIAQIGLQNNKNILLNTPEDRLMYIIEVLLSSKKIIKIDELAYEINIGRTTLINDLKKIEALFNMYDIKISKKQNFGINVSGDELNIRLFILEYLYKSFIKNSSSQMVNSENYEKIRNNITELFNSNKFHLSDETLMEILNYIMVMLIRINNDKNITSLEKKYESIFEFEEYNLSVIIAEMLDKQFGYQLNKYEIAFLTLPLIGRKASLNFNNIIVKSNVNLLIDEIIKEINENLGVPIKKDDAIVGNFAYHLNFMLNRLVFNIKNKNEIINDIKRNYPLPYEMAKLAAKVIEKKYDLKVWEDEIGYMALYFASYIEQHKLKTTAINKVALVCGTGLGSTQFLNIKLRKLLGENVIINNYSDMKLSKELLDQYDVVLTTVDFNINTETPIIKVNIIFDDDYLMKEIEKKISLKNYNMNNFQANDPVLSLVFHEDSFFVLEKDNYMDNLEIMLDELLKLGKVDEGFKKRIIERELKAATTFGNYVAVPHAINYKGEGLSISFGILKKNVIWSENEVRVIILIMIPTEDSLNKDLLIKVYEQLLTLAQNRQTIENMSKVKNYKEFKSILLKEIII